MDTLLLFVFRVAALLYSVVIHEVAHGVMANSMGDPTAKNLGRLNLNPLKHLDLFGSIILPLFLLLISSPFVFGYAKPVPYNIDNISDKKYGPAKIAAAGPLSNISLAILFGLALRFLPDSLSNPFLVDLLVYVVFLNLVLAIFNLFPVPPLDGHWLLMSALSDRFQTFKLFLYRYSIFLLIFFILFIFPLLNGLIVFLARLISGF